MKKKDLVNIIENLKRKITVDDHKGIIRWKIAASTSVNNLMTENWKISTQLKGYF